MDAHTQTYPYESDFNDEYYKARKAVLQLIEAKGIIRTVQVHRGVGILDLTDNRYICIK